jgi:beta-glucosidase
MLNRSGVLFAILGLSVILGFLFYSCGSGNQGKALSSTDRKVDSVIAKLTLAEKIGQMEMVSSNYANEPETLREMVRKGLVGAILNETDPKVVNELQKIAIEQSPGGIPLLIGRDVVHGFHTIFPIPIGQAASWNAELIEQAARYSAIEARAAGVNWTLSPMLDVTRDARWGRVAESFGEDTYLTSILGSATIKGYQGGRIAAEDRIASCVKHFAAYGAVEAGRDYNTVSISEQDLRNVYLPSYQAAIKAGAGTLMTAYNELNGIPSTANSFLLTQVLRHEWQYKGFVLSDWNAIPELINHGFAEDEKQSAALAFNAGVEMEMISSVYSTNLPELVKNGSVSENQIDEAVHHIIRVKMDLGLFDHPYTDNNKLPTLNQQQGIEIARQLATESMVLLQNKRNVLPLKKNINKIAVIGPMANDRYEQLGTWSYDADTNLSITPLHAIVDLLGKDRVLYMKGLSHSRDFSKTQFQQVKANAAQCDAIIVFVGEEAILSGEAHCRANINLPGAQSELIKMLTETGKPLITVVFSGRPNAVSDIINYTDALFFAWHPGTMAGPAIADLLFGKEVPSGKLPISVPKSGGQCPIYYSTKSTGRPANIQEWKPMDQIPVRAFQGSAGNTSHHLDDGFAPQFPFGFGLSYTTFTYNQLSISSNTIKIGEELTATVTVSNIGNYPADEVVQLYIRDLAGSITRPVKELKGFKRVHIEPGNSVQVEFKLNTNDLAFYKSMNEKVIEPGWYNLWIGSDSGSGLLATFKLY